MVQELQPRHGTSFQNSYVSLTGSHIYTDAQTQICTSKKLYAPGIMLMVEARNQNISKGTMAKKKKKQLEHGMLKKKNNNNKNQADHDGPVSQT